MFEKLWSWIGWPIIKWPFGFFILWFILSQIWCLETKKDYPQQIISAIKEIKIPQLKFDFKLFDAGRAIK